MLSHTFKDPEIIEPEQTKRSMSVASCLRCAVAKEESCFQVCVCILLTQLWMGSTKMSLTQIPLSFKKAKDHSRLAAETSVYQYVLRLFWKHLLSSFPQRIQIEIHLIPESGIFNSTGVQQPRSWQSCIFAEWCPAPCCTSCQLRQVPVTLGTFNIRQIFLFCYHFGFWCLMSIYLWLQEPVSSELFAQPIAYTSFSLCLWPMSVLLLLDIFNVIICTPL